MLWKIYSRNSNFNSGEIPISIIWRILPTFLNNFWAISIPVEIVQISWNYTTHNSEKSFVTATDNVGDVFILNSWFGVSFLIFPEKKNGIFGRILKRIFEGILTGYSEQTFGIVTGSISSRISIIGMIIDKVQEGMHEESFLKYGEEILEMGTVINYWIF